MRKMPLAVIGLLQVLGVAAYCSLIGLFFQYVAEFFSDPRNFSRCFNAGPFGLLCRFDWIFSLWLCCLFILALRDKKSFAAFGLYRPLFLCAHSGYYFSSVFNWLVNLCCFPDIYF